MKIYFEFNDISKKKKTLFAITYLRERAQHWMQFKLAEYLNNSKKNKNEMFDDYKFFEKKFRRIFDVSNEKQTTKRIIQHIVQKSSASNYIVRFQKYTSLIKWNDTVLKMMFQRNLKNNVKNELMRYEKSINTFENFIEAAIELNDKLYERVMKRRHTER